MAASVPPVMMVSAKPFSMASFAWPMASVAKHRRWLRCRRTLGVIGDGNVTRSLVGDHLRDSHGRNPGGANIVDLEHPLFDDFESSYPITKNHPCRWGSYSPWKAQPVSGLPRGDYAYWVKRAILRASFLSIKFEALKSFTWPQSLWRNWWYQTAHSR